MGRIRAAILGAGGFTGQELLRLARFHPELRVEMITSNEYDGRLLKDVFPSLQTDSYQKLGFVRHPDSAEAFAGLDAVFMATPDEVSLHWAPLLLGRVKIIDLAGTFRLKDPAAFEQFYKLKHSQPQLLKQAVYGLSEIHREEIRGASLLANPGCYPTAAILPLFAIRKELSLFSDHIVIDAKSGTSGAGGRKEKDSMGYSTVYENFRAYRVEAHQHMPEISQETALFSGSPKQIRFTAHLLPMFRGILATTYLHPKEKISVSSLREKLSAAMKSCAEENTFLRYREDPNSVETRHVRDSNYCDFSFHADDSGMVTVISTIDNLVKGAAGSAIQNFNLMFSLPETAGFFP